MRNLIIFIFSIFAMASENLDSLLTNLETESELSKETKKESLGHYIIFTRNDLDIINANKLSDILKYIPLTSTHKTRFGTYEVVELGSTGEYPSSVKIFLNNKDLSGAYTNTSSFNYYDLPLTFIDHIEVYIGAAAITLGNTPSSLIIKLYTKLPEREENSIIKNSISNNLSYQNDFFVAKTIDNENSYLIMLNNLQNNPKKIEVNNKELSLNGNQKYLYANYKHKNSFFEISSSFIKGSPFMGFSKDNSPENISATNKNYSLNYQLKKENYKLNISYSETDRIYEETNNDNGIYNFLNENNVTYFNEDRSLSKLNFLLSKNTNFNNNSLFLAIAQTTLNEKINRLKYSTDGESEKKDGKKFVTIGTIPIYSLMAENRHNFNDRNLLFTSLKYDFYKGSSNYKSAKNYIARVGYISIPNNNLKIKAFLTKSYKPVSIMQQQFAKNSLKQPKGTIASIETSYKQNRNYFSVLFGKSKMVDMIVYSPNGPKNIDKTINAYFLKLNYRYQISLYNKIDTSYSKTFVDENLNTKEKVTLIWLKKYRKLSLFSGIIYYSGYQYQDIKVDNSYNFNLGVKYEINKLVSLSFKGNNIFNDSLKEAYKTAYSSGTYQSENQQFLLEMEINF